MSDDLDREASQLQAESDGAIAEAEARKAVEDAMERWGIDVEGMGPKFRQALLDERAERLKVDFDALARASSPPTDEEVDAILGVVEEADPLRVKVALVRMAVEVRRLRARAKRKRKSS
jgi:hypothetical protein